MADKNTGDLFIKVGLDLSAVDQGLVYLNKKVPENIKALEEKLKQEQSKLNIEAQGAKNDDAYLDARYHRLNQILKVQQQLSNLYNVENKTSGNAKALTAKLKIDEQMAARKKELEETTNILKMIKRLDEAEKSHKAQSLLEAMTEGRAAYRSNSRYGRSERQSFKDNATAKITQITNSLNELRTATSSVDGIINKTIEIFGKVPKALGPAGIAITAVTTSLLALPFAGKKVQDTLLELAQPATKAGDALYVASRGAQMTISEFAEFSRVCKVTGIELSEVTDVTKKMHAALIRVESGMTGAGAASSKLLINNLKQYGVEIRKQNGELKNAYEMSKSLAEGLKRAQSQGRGRDFLAIIGASGDYATYLEDLKSNIDLEKKIVKNRLADATLAHNTQGYLNALNLQKNNLENAISSAFVPVAYDIIPKMTEQLGRLTNVINDNADGIRAIAEVAGNAALKVTDLGVSLTETFSKGVKIYTDKLEIGKSENDLIDRLKKEYGGKLREIKSFEDYIRVTAPDLSKDIQDYKSGAALKAKDNALEEERKKLEAEIERVKKEAEQKLKTADSLFSAEKYPDAWERRSKRARYESEISKQLTADIAELTRLSHLAEREINGKFNLLENRATALGKKLKEYDIFSKWGNTDAAKKFLSDDTGNEEQKKNLTMAEQNARASRMEKLQEELQKLQLDAQYGDNWYEKSLAEVDIWQDKQLKAIESLKNHWKEYEEEKALITETYTAKREAIEKKLQDDLKQINEETANLAFERTHTAFEKQLRDIERWKEVQLEKARTAEHVASIEANAAERASAAIQRETDRIKGNFLTLNEKIFAQEHSQRDIDTFRAQKERAEMLQQGNPAELVEHWYQNEIAKINSNRDRNYNRDPKLGRRRQSGNIDIVYGNDLASTTFDLIYGDRATPKLQQNNFYGDLQAKVSEQLKSLNIKPLQDFSVAMQPLTQEMAALSQTAGSIAQSLSARQQPPQIMQPPNITVSPSININLAGAYVFDNAMRAQLTDDIVTEVTDKIKEAVETAANRQNYSYAR